MEVTNYRRRCKCVSRCAEEAWCFEDVEELLVTYQAASHRRGMSQSVWGMSARAVIKHAHEDECEDLWKAGGSASACHSRPRRTPETWMDVRHNQVCWARRDGGRSVLYISSRLPACNDDICPVPASVAASCPSAPSAQYQSASLSSGEVA